MAKIKGTTNNYSPKNVKGKGKAIKKKNKHSSKKASVGQG